MSVSEPFRCMFPSWHYISCDKRSILVHTLSTVLVCKLVSLQSVLPWKKTVLLANTVILPEHYKVAEFRIPVLGNSSNLGNLCSVQLSDLSILLFIMFWEFCSCRNEGPGTRIYCYNSVYHFLLILQVSESDNLPKSLCYRCMYNLENFYDFRKRSVDAVALLESCIGQSEGSTEVV